MQTAIRKLFQWMPFLFGIGFIAPLIAQGMAALGWQAPLGIGRLAFGLGIGGLWGLYAVWQGRWI